MARYQAPSREARALLGALALAQEITDATDCGAIADAELMLAEFRYRFLEIHAGHEVRLANPGTHPPVQKVISVTNGRALLPSGVICKLDRLTVVI